MSVSGSNFGKIDLGYKKRKVKRVIDDVIRSAKSAVDDQLASDITNLQTDSAAHAANISNLQTDSGTHFTNIGILQTDSVAHATNISNLQTDSDTHFTNIQNLQNDNIEHGVNILNLFTDNAVQTTNISNLQGTSGTLITKTDALEDKTLYLSTSLNESKFSGTLKASNLFGVGNAVPNGTGYFLPSERPLLPNYVMVTGNSSASALTFKVAADPIKIWNLSAVPNVSSTFNSPLIVNGTFNSEAATVDSLTVNGPITINNGIQSSYSLPVIGPAFIGSSLMSYNTSGGLIWNRPSYLRTYRLDTAPTPSSHIFVPDQTVFPFQPTPPLNLITLMNTTGVLGELEKGTYTVKYNGTYQRVFHATCSVYIRQEEKGSFDFKLTMYNVTENKILGTSTFRAESKVTDQHCLHGCGNITNNDEINVLLEIITNNSADVEVLIGSPNFNIFLN